MKPEQICDALRRRYADVAERPVGQFKYPVGRESAERLDYRRDFLDRIPSDVVEHFVGVGNPFSLGEPEPGWNVLDIGCGCGFDSQMAALCVGPTGRVRGIDMSPEMLRVARAGLEGRGLLNVEFIEGRAEDLPVDSAWADLVISNGVLNLATCKASAFAPKSPASSSPVGGSRPPTWCSSKTCPKTSEMTDSRGRTESAVRYRVGPTWKVCVPLGWLTRRLSARAVTGRPTTPKRCTSGLGSRFDCV